jgi:hypothetical protein
VDELKAHPWFRGMDWSRLQEAEAPYVPPVGRRIGEIIATLSRLPRDDPSFAPMLRELTSNFDDFSKLAPDDPRNAPPGGGAGDGHGGAGAGADGLAHGEGKEGEGAARRGSKARNKFVGYTFKRTSDGRLAMGGPGGALTYADGGGPGGAPAAAGGNGGGAGGAAAPGSVASGAVPRH